MTLQIILCSAFALVSLAAGLLDARTMKIPNALCAAVLALALIRVLASEMSVLSCVAGLLIAGLPLFIARKLKRGAFGWGDIKLAAASGAFTGFGLAPYALSISLAVFLPAAAILLLFKRKSKGEAVAFGPSIAAGFITATILNLIGVMNV